MGPRRVKRMGDDGGPSPQEGWGMDVREGHSHSQEAKKGFIVNMIAGRDRSFILERR